MRPPLVVVPDVGPKDLPYRAMAVLLEGVVVLATLGRVLSRRRLGVDLLSLALAGTALVMFLRRPAEDEAAEATAAPGPS